MSRIDTKLPAEIDVRMVRFAPGNVIVSTGHTLFEILRRRINIILFGQ